MIENPALVSSGKEDIGVNCCQDLLGEELIIENIIQEEIMETVKERELMYNDYLALIETEEKVIEDIDNQIERAEEELEDINISIDLKEAERLGKIKSIYDTILTTREAKQAKLEELENELEGRRNYLKSLRDDSEDEDEDELIDRQYEDAQNRENHLSEVIEAVEFMDGDEPTVSSVDGVYHIPSKKNSGPYIITDSPYVIGTDGQVLF